MNKRKTKRKTKRKINNKYKETNQFWTIQSVKKKPKILFLFSDNDKDKNKESLKTEVESWKDLVEENKD